MGDCFVVRTCQNQEDLLKHFHEEVHRAKCEYGLLLKGSIISRIEPTGRYQLLLLFEK